MATYYSSTCEQGPELNNIIYNLAVDGDTVVLPTGNVTWGAGNTPYYLTNAITLCGQGTGTIINIAADAPAFLGGTINLWAPATVSGLTIVSNDSVGGRTAFGCAIYNSRGDGWRITNINYWGSIQETYFAACQSNGVIDHCAITGRSPTSELVFMRGQSNAWTTPSTLGTTGAVYIEDCTFGGSGYICDANANAKMVVRYNTISNLMKVDAHGFASNSPAVSFRHVEVYGNTWLEQNFTTWAAMEIRGGSAMVFNNASKAGWIFLTDYGTQAQWANFNYIYQTPFNYPIIEQVGVGYGYGAASQPAYLWNNTRNGNPWPRDFWPVGATVFQTNSSGYAIGSTGIGIDRLDAIVNSGNAAVFAGDTGHYKIVSTRFPSVPNVLYIESPGLLQAIPAAQTLGNVGAAALYQYQTNTTGVFTEADVIKNNRDFFAQAGFDTLTGTSTGTTAQMNALTPTVTGYGFWVTDQGSWNKTVPANTAGLLYTYSGGWNLAYTPYQYPFFWADSSGVNYVYKRLGGHLKLYGLAPA